MKNLTTFQKWSLGATAFIGLAVAGLAVAQYKQSGEFLFLKKKTDDAIDKASTAEKKAEQVKKVVSSFSGRR